MEYHWKNLLKDTDHVLNEILKDYGDKIITCGYMYAGYLRGDKKLGIRTVIIHYHSEDGTARFDELQNLDGYAKIEGLNDGDIADLSLLIDRTYVVKMSKPGIITKKHLTYIGQADILVVINETGEVKEYGKVYKENHLDDY